MIGYFKRFNHLLLILAVISCENSSVSKSRKVLVKHKSSITAKDILGNSEYLAISYGGYRYIDHSIEPTLKELKEDLKILEAMVIKILRAYKLHLPQASKLLKVINELKAEDSGFEMYVMLGAWIDCKKTWTNEKPDHNEEGIS